MTARERRTEMETFVVHIHRRPEVDDAAQFVGVVERTDAAISRPFGSLEGLLALLGVRPEADTCRPNPIAEPD